MSSPAPASANTITCTQCGGENELASGRRLFQCQYCDATLFVDRGGVVNHYRLPPLLGADEARAALRRWMAGNETVKDLDKKSSLGGLRAVSFPMWLFRVRRGGSWVFGALFCRAAHRSGLEPAWGNVNIGFRLAMNAE